MVSKLSRFYYSVKLWILSEWGKMSREQGQAEPTAEQIDRWLKRLYGNEFGSTKEQAEWVKVKAGKLTATRLLLPSLNLAWEGLFGVV